MAEPEIALVLLPATSKLDSNFQLGKAEMTKTVLVPLANGCEELEAITVTDLLVRAGAQVVRASLDERLEVLASRGAKLMADCSLKDIENQQFDLIALPGGLPGADHLKNSPTLQSIIKSQHKNNGLIGAICAAPKALIESGVINGKQITCYPGALEAEDTSSIEITNDPVKVDDNIITSRGPGTALDFALTLIEHLFDAEKREEVEAPLVR